MNQTFSFEESKEVASHVVHPSHTDVFSHPLKKTYFEPLLTVDVACFMPAYEGVKLHFIATDVSLDVVEFSLDDENRYTLTKINGEVVDLTSDNFYDDLESLPEEEKFSELKTIKNAAIVPAPHAYEGEIRLSIGAPDWLQSGWVDCDFASDGYQFIGQLTANTLFRTLFLFYDHQKRRVLQIIECT